MNDQHAVFAHLVGDRIVRLTEWAPYVDSLGKYYPLDEARYGTGQQLTVGQFAVTDLVVRSQSDPRYASAPRKREGVVVWTRAYKSESYAIKKVLEPLGFKGKGGGWVYRNDRPYEQGWWQTAQMCGHPTLYDRTEGGYRTLVTTLRPE